MEKRTHSFSHKQESLSGLVTIEEGKKTTEFRKRARHYEIALEETQFGKYNYYLIILCGMVLSNVLLETLGISFVLPVSECDLHLSIKERGILSAIGFAGIISSSHLWGFLADTKGRRKIVLPTMFVGFIVTLISSFSNNFWQLVILRFINGFCVSGGSAVIYAYLGEFHTMHSRSRAIMGAATIFGMGAILLPAIAWLVINQEWRFFIPFLNITYKPWRLFLVVCGIPGFISSIWLFYMPESPKFLLSQGKEEETLAILQQIFHTNTGKSADEFPISRVLEDADAAPNRKCEEENSNAVSGLASAMWAQTKPLISGEHIRTTILVCTIQFWVFVTSNGTYMWFPYIMNNVVEFVNKHPGEKKFICDIVYAKNTELLAAASNNLTSAVEEHCVETLETSTYHHALVLEIVFALGFVVIGAIINNISKELILFICLGVSGTCGIALLFVNDIMMAIRLYQVLLICGLGGVVLNAATVDLYPTHLRAMAICISLMMGRLGCVVGANIVGMLISNHCEAVFLASGISLVISAFLAFLIPKPPKSASALPRNVSILSMNGGLPRNASLISMSGGLPRNSSLVSMTGN